MEGRLPKGVLLKKVFDAIKEMVSDVNLECSESGVTVQAMDASHVSLVAMELKYGAFDHYRCSHVRSLGLNMGQVAKVFKLCGNDDQVIIRNDEDSDFVSFIFECAPEEKVSDFELRLMQIDSEHLGVPETEFAATVLLPSRHFAKVVGDLGQFSDSMAIEVNPKGVKFSAKGDFGSGNVLYKARSSGGDDVEIQTDTTTSLVFATRYLNYFTKACGLATNVELCMSADKPLQVTFRIDNDDNVGTLKFYLAPKMDESTD